MITRCEGNVLYELAGQPAEALGTQTLAGFFCGGEIGPVGGKAFLHGFTATLAIFLEP